MSDATVKWDTRHTAACCSDLSRPLAIYEGYLNVRHERKREGTLLHGSLQTSLCVLKLPANVPGTSTFCAAWSHRLMLSHAWPVKMGNAAWLLCSSQCRLEWVCVGRCMAALKAHGKVDYADLLRSLQGIA